MVRAVPAILLLLLAALFPVRASASDPPRLLVPGDVDQRAAVAEELFDQGRRLSGIGRYAEACAHFANSERLDHGVGTLLNLADCYEKNGQTASAYATASPIGSGPRALIRSASVWPPRCSSTMYGTPVAPAPVLMP